MIEPEIVAENEPEITPRPLWVSLLAAFFGMVFIFSALTKGFTVDDGAIARSPFFELMLVKQELVETRDQAALATRGIVAMELLIGLLFFQTSFLRRVIVPFTAFVLAAFTVYLAWMMMFKPEAEDCGCFGELVKMTPAVSILKNLVLLGILVPIYRFANSAKRSMGIPIGMMAFSLAFAIFAMPAPDEAPPTPPIENGQKAPSKFAVFDTLRNGDTKLSLTEGVRLACFFSLDCDHCRELSMQLGDTYDIFEPAKLGYVFLGEEEQVPDFLGQISADVAIPYTISSALTFFDFTGDKPPRVYLLKDGAIVEQWDPEEFFDIGIFEEAVQGLAAPSEADPEPSSEALEK